MTAIRRIIRLVDCRAVIIVVVVDNCVRSVSVEYRTRDTVFAVIPEPTMSCMTFDTYSIVVPMYFLLLLMLFASHFMKLGIQLSKLVSESFSETEKYR